MSALILRIIACVAMLLDHIGYMYNIMILRAIGRIAFPIFAYLLSNGFQRTSCRWRYALRLGIFALVSQIPFSLFCTNTFTYRTGNVFFTLFVALLCIWVTDLMRSNKVTKWFCWVPLLVSCVVYQQGWLRSDYGARGIILAMVFYLLDGKKWWKMLLVVAGCVFSVFYTHLLSMGLGLLATGKLVLPSISRWDWWQLFSLCALPLIFLYNGKKGPQPANKLLAKTVQIGFYLFYPAHLFVIWLVHFL